MVAPDSLKEETLARLEGRRGRLLDVSRAIHERPEIGYEEHFAAARLCDELEAAGFTVERAAGGIETAFVATAPGSRPGGPVIAILAEYDALAGLGHGCGHNFIAACGLGAALAAAPVLEQLPGTIRLYGTPAEEGGCGKVRMLDAGLFDGVDVAMIFHPINGRNEVTAQCLAATPLEVRFRGKAAHAAAAPWDGVNALDAMISLFSSIGLLRQQIRPDARIHGVITNGGQAFNVIPELTEARLGVRSFDTPYMYALLDRVEAMAQAAAQATGCQVEVARGLAMESHKYNGVLAGLAEANLARRGRELSPAAPVLASTDFGNVSQRMPAVSLKVDCYPAEHPAHTQAWVAGGTAERAQTGMVDAAAALALTAVDLLADPGLVEAAWLEFRACEQGPSAPGDSAGRDSAAPPPQILRWRSG